MQDHRGYLLAPDFDRLPQSWIWCPRCGRLAVRHLANGPGFECSHCRELSVHAPRTRVLDGARAVERVIRGVDNVHGFIAYRGAELRVRRQPDGTWRVVGR